MRERERVGPGVLVILLGSLQVYAQTAEDMAKRRELIEEAQKARKANDHEKALTLAARARKIQSTPSLRLFIAQELYSTGQLANSLIHAELCEAEATDEKVLKNREEILRACNALIAQLKRNAAQVIVSMPTLPPEAQVTVGGRMVPESLYGKPYLLSPGNIKIDATAPGCMPFHRQLAVGAGEEVTVLVLLPHLPDAKPLPQPPLRKQAPKGRRSPSPNRVYRDSPRAWDIRGINLRS
jgi:hypothetical protein